jgi:TonB family protein
MFGEKPQTMRISVPTLLLCVATLNAEPAAQSPKNGAFPEDPVFGETIVPPGEGLLSAFSIGVKLTAAGLRLKENAILGTLALPAYPESMLNAGITGKTEVAFDIKVDGSIERITVLRSPNPEFIEPTLAAVKTWRMPPLKWISDAKTVRVTATFVFSIFN